MKVFGAPLLIVLWSFAYFSNAQVSESDVRAAAQPELKSQTASPAVVQSDNVDSAAVDAHTEIVETPKSQSHVEQSHAAVTNSVDKDTGSVDKNTGSVDKSTDAVDKKSIHLPEPIKPNRSAYLVNIVVGLLFIVALILGIGWFMRRFNQGGLFSSAAAMKIVATLPLGTRERLVVVDVSGQQILLGITATHINSLHVFPDPVIDTQVPPAQSDFSQKLMAMLHQKNNKSPSDN